MGIHKAKLTRAITRARCNYLWGQYRRGHITYARDVRPKMKRALPVRENEVDDLYDTFIEFIGDEHNMVVCDGCGVLTDTWDYGGERGEDRLCYNCREDN